MRSYLTYYFAGVSTAGIALIVGFGGALIFSNSVLTKTPVQPTRIERAAKELDHPPRTQLIVPAYATPVIATPQISQPTSIADTTASPSEGSRPAVAAQSEGAARTDVADNLRMDKDAATPLNQPAQLPMSNSHAQQDSPVSMAKRRRELELKRVREAARADRRRLAAAKQKQEIAAAADAVRRIMHDRRDHPGTDPMMRSFNMGFSTD